MNRPIVVCDAGPLIALAGCRQLELLPQLFKAIHVPRSVLVESAADRSRSGATAIGNFVNTHATVHEDRSDPVYQRVATHLDEGEAQALSLAMMLGCGVLMDERRGRDAAQRLGLTVFGVLGTLLQAKRTGRIGSVAPLIAQMHGNGYRISDELLKKVLELADEVGAYALSPRK